MSSETFGEFNSTLQGLALKATKRSLALPSDLPFHRSMDTDLAKSLDVFSSRILSMTNRLLSLISASEDSGRNPRRMLMDQDDVLDNFRSLVVDPVDHLLERADISLDECLGRTKAPAIAVNPPKSPQKKRIQASGRLDRVLQHASHLPKPQLSFKKKPDNNNHSPWRPSLSHKYNAKVPLGYDYRDPDISLDSTDTISPPHPYRYEIRHISYPSRMFQSSPPIPPKSFDDTPFHWVATPDDFASMLEILRKANELAVDLEHHSYRTFSGFLCLMQISTRDEDWIVDTLVLREELAELNEVFTDPNIVKVLHGAESDIVWLQQDFNLYIVNLFDTYHASRVLEFPRHGLASLLEMYCDFTPDKRYQLADWRIRPLPHEMLLYARSDTHFLLYIYDNLRNALLDRALSRAHSRQPSPPSGATSTNANSADPSHALVREVLTRSESTALRFYEKEVYDADTGTGTGGWDTLVKKWNKETLLVEGRQRRVFLSVHAWRDRVAREEDESTRYVLPNHSLIRLAEYPPVDVAALISSFQPIPPVIRRRSKELLDVIKSSLAASDLPVISSSPPPKVESTPVVRENQKKIQDASHLWLKVSQPNNATASSSSLFGPRRAATLPKNAPHATCTSSLFGNLKSITSSDPSANAVIGRSSFLELTAKIHNTLVITPSVPKTVDRQPVKEPSATTTSNPSAELESEQAEIVHVPSSERQTIKSEIEDFVVVVGQTRKNKRKRKKAPLSSVRTMDQSRSGSAQSDVEGSMTKKTKSSKAEDQDGSPALEVFDFSAEPNLLDAIPEQPGVKRLKTRKPRGESTVRKNADFPAPPKAHREPKSGNQSRTFK